MLGLIEGLNESYDNILDDGREEVYGVPVFYDDDEMYDQLLEDE